MKYIGILVMAVGVAVAASAGARLTPTMHEHMTLEGAAKFRGADEKEAFEAYCAARAEADLSPAEGCPGASEDAAIEQAEEDEVAAPTFDSLVAERRGELADFREAEPELPEAVRHARTAWLEAAEAGVEPVARAAVAKPPGPGARLGNWAGAYGLVFALGLVLVVGGATMGRLAIKREATAEPSRLEGARAPEDFGQLLKALRDEVKKLGAEMRAVTDPKAEDFTRTKVTIEGLQLESFERLVDARSRVQAKYGMGGYAELFGPLSAGERKTNRAWSALVDRHWPEATESVTNAENDLDRAVEVFESLAR